MHPYIKYVNPYLGKLLQDLKMDKSFVKGEGCYLYDSDGKRYLDCIAAYGALPFGYNHPEIWECIQTYHHLQEPSFIQPSALNGAGELAEKLINLTPEGLRYVTFTNSGAESVEAAIKLCRSATKRYGILSTKNSFHGKTLGALSATGKSTYQKAFGAPVEGFNYIDYGNINALEEELATRGEYYAAFIVEPIQGEGGIVEPPKGYLKKVKEICQRYGILLIFDEIQTGLGRTGKLFACEDEGVTPDVMVLAKALGGGLVPIGACLCTEDVYNEEFAHKHSSTFAGNSLACRIGIKVLDMLTEDNYKIMRNVEENGRFLKEGLEGLQQKYPDIIRSIRGRGLMLGVEFNTDKRIYSRSMLGILAEQDLLTPLISSYLLNVENLRVAPTLNGNNVIRVEPPLIITKEECEECVNGFAEMLKVLGQRNTAFFVSFLTSGEKREGKIENHEIKRNSISEVLVEEDDGRFAFLMHPLDLKNYSEFDESLEVFTTEELKQLVGSLNTMMEPFVLSDVKITSKNGNKAYGEFIVIPKTTEELINLPKEDVLNELRKALKIAYDRGAKIVGLGAFTSVVSKGGLYLKDEGIPLTTGNSYTVVSAVDAVSEALNRLGIPLKEAVVAIVGASGSIGKGISMLLAGKVSNLILVGNPHNAESSKRRLFNLAGEFYRKLVVDNELALELAIGERMTSTSGASVREFSQLAEKINERNSPITVTIDVKKALKQADVIICATNSIEQFITPENVKTGAIICDISRPGNVSQEMDQKRPDVLVIDGGIIGVPGRPSLGWNFGLNKGLVYACMAETMMLALEKHYKHTSVGSSGISLENILLTRELGRKHGFQLAELRSFNKPIDSNRWNKFLAYRS